MTPEAMEAEAGRLLLAAYKARMERMGPQDAHECRHIEMAVYAGNSDDEDDGCRLDLTLAAAHARGVAEERARWTVERLAKALESSTQLRGVTGRMGRLNGAWYAGVAEQALAAMAPSSPSDDRGGPKGAGGVEECQTCGIRGGAAHVHVGFR